MESLDCTTLGSLAERLESTSLSDTAGWQALCEELASASDVARRGEHCSAELLTLCRDGLLAMTSGAGADRLQLIEAVADGVAVAEALHAERSPGADQLRQVAGRLAQLVSDCALPDAAAPPAAATLNDAARLLMQTNPDNRDQLIALRAVLTTLESTGELQATAAGLIHRAAVRLDAVLQAGDDRTDEVLGAVGQLIEEAMAMTEMASQEHSEQPVGTGSAPTEVAHAAADSPLDHMPAEVDTDLLGEFLAESGDLIAKAEDALLSLENDPEDMDAVGTVFRAFHTVKGTSAFMDLKLIAELGHHAESLLSRVRDREIRYSGGYADLSLRSLDMIKTLLAAVKGVLVSGGPLLKPQGYDELMDVLADPERHGISEESDECTLPRLGDILVAQGAVEREAIEELAAASSPDPLGQRLVKANAASLPDVGQALRTQRRMTCKAQDVDASIRVSTERLDRLIDMVGELVIAHSMVAQDELLVGGAHHDMLKKVSHTSKIVRELQDMSMSMRMVPLKATFNKMARLVRDLARKVGKSVQFVSEGEETEIDRNLVDVIADPLVHMVRNAVDHGIETPDERERRGKPSSGVVHLCAYHSAGRVVVEIRDDGKGLDREAILTKARERGLIAEGTLLSDREVYNLVFLPGFSTAKEVTDVSGRGVGMDVVKKNIEALRGQAEILSEPGKGSIFRISLPLTLAIIDGMVVRVGSERYVLPTVSIIRSIKPESKDLATVLGRGEMLQLQGRLIPLFRLAELYQLEGAQKDLTNALVVVVEDDTQQAGLVIDELIGRQQVVIKSLGETMQNLPGISGGAIMPNGRVGLILDIGSLVKFANAA
jgi:two-component system chemotaxis sensor kinase CheA